MDDSVASSSALSRAPSLAGRADSMKGQPENPAVLQDLNLTCGMPCGAITRRPDPISLPKSLRSPAGLRP